MKTWFIAGLGLVLSACAGSETRELAGPQALPPPPLEDALFAAPLPPGLHDDVFALSAPMRAYLATTVAEHMRNQGPRVGLFEAIRDDLVVRYEASFTRTAAEAFTARSGNCLSLVILTAAFAKQLDIPVRYQSVFDNDSWSRYKGIAFLSGHVNITLGQHAASIVRDSAPALTIDFLLPDGGQAALHTRAIDEATIVAMYMNNRAAETLAQGQIDAAYWWVREGIHTAPNFSAAYNTLGVIYRHRKQLALAERAFRYALWREPASELIVGNLAELLAQTGRPVEAEALRQGLTEMQRVAPYHYYDLGLAALSQSDYEGARLLFLEQLRRTPYDHELLFALGMTYLRLNDSALARKYVGLALENSTTQQSRGIYAAKLGHLKEVQRQN